MSELAKQFELEEHCKISIIKGGTGILLETILQTKNGDIFLPGSARYYSDTTSLKFVDTTTVGYNEAVLMVRKDNPKNINYLMDLLNPEIRAVFSNKNSGSIGKEAFKVLSRYGNYEDFILNAVKITTDSKDLTKMLINDEADVAINWKAIKYWDENKDYLDVIDIDRQYSDKTPLIVSLLSYSKNKELSLKFYKKVTSEQGKATFNKYGF
ncbi:MAG: substrate-binding domain-containing protein [Bacteroidales bacterium]|nr:substrate-binding domain-containing protein [Bacteroidales bacterium]